jgi:membrane-associated phospholipid phosphatase
VRPQRVKPDTWWFDVALVAAFVLLTVLLAAKTRLLGLDLAVRDFADAHRPTGLFWLLRVLNYAGQGGWVLTPLAAIVAFVLAVRRRSVRPFLPVAGAFIITYLAIGPLKLWTDRAAASSHIPHPEWLFHDPSGLSYPSGHVVNAIVWYGVLAYLLRHVLTERQRLIVRYGAPALVLVTTTYLSYHWITDGLAAILLGLLLDRFLRRVPWEAIPLGRLERQRQTSDVTATA